MDAADIISCFFGAVQAVVQSVLLRKFFSGKPNIPFALLFTALEAAVNCLPLPLPIGLITSLFGVILYCKAALRGNRCQALLFGVLSAEIMWLSVGIINSVLAILTGIMTVFPLRFVGMIFLVFGNVLSLGAYFVTCVTACGIIKNERVRPQNTPAVTVQLFMMFTVEVYIVRALYSKADTDSDVSANIGILLVQVLEMISVFCMLLAYKKMADNFRMNEKIKIYNEQRRFDKQYIDEIKSYYDTARSLRHDLKNHFLIISGLLRKERYQNALDYIAKLDKIRENSEVKYHTGCPILDIILADKLSRAVGKFTVNCAAVPEMDETDICVIFANAVDNAISAVSKLPDNEREIVISTQKQGDLLFINIENTYDGAPFEIGTGIENIISAAENYGGTVKIITQDNKFILKIVLCNSQH